MTSNGICIDSVLGPISLASRLVDGEEQLCGLTFAVSAVNGVATPLLQAAERQLFEYLDGRRRVFDVPLVLEGSPFQVAVWQALHAIRYGESRSYGEIAAAVGNPLAARAVGNACGGNPLAIIVPCHRIVANGGKIGGFSAGLDIKRRLLALESIKVK